MARLYEFLRQEVPTKSGGMNSSHGASVPFEKEFRWLNVSVRP